MVKLEVVQEAVVLLQKSPFRGFYVLLGSVTSVSLEQGIDYEVPGKQIPASPVYR